LKVKLAAYGLTIVLVALATLLGFLFDWRDARANVIMLYMLGVVYTATSMGRGPAIFTSILSVLAFDYFFVSPAIGFYPADVKYFFSLSVMLSVAILVSELATRARERAKLAQERVQTTEAQYSLSRDLSSTKAVDELLSVAVRHFSEVFHCKAAILLPREADGKLFPAVTNQPFELSEAELSSARDAYMTKHLVDPANDTDNGAFGLYLPLIGSQKTVGVVGLISSEGAFDFDQPHRNLLFAFANQIAVALERAVLWKTTEEANIRADRERLRSALLSSVSHDLRTPLSSITGAASSLIESVDVMSSDTVKELLHSIYDEADRLNRLVGNLLDMTRLQAGIITVKKDWNSLEEIVGAAITRLRGRLRDHKVVVKFPDDLPLIDVDPTLIEQLFINLLDNAAKYSKAGNEIRISAQVSNRVLTVEVFNTGSELLSGEEAKVFEKFYRGRHTLTGGGVGLGLAICQAIVQTHGGKILAENMSGEGVSFFVTLPLEGEAPKVIPEEESVEASK
jgi:two-component system sensor histidine kinase KdpD